MYTSERERLWQQQLKTTTEGLSIIQGERHVMHFRYLCSDFLIL